MWSPDGKKLSGRYGTWNGQEFELRSPEPIRGAIYLVQEGGDPPGREWRTHDQANQFPKPPVAYTLGVPPEEVTNIHSVLATGELSPGRVVSIYAEDQDGNLAVVAGSGFWTEDKQALIDNYGFETGSVSEPVSRLPVFGWLRADKVSNIKSIVDWRQNDA